MVLLIVLFIFVYDLYDAVEGFQISRLRIDHRRRALAMLDSNNPFSASSPSNSIDSNANSNSSLPIEEVSSSPKTGKSGFAGRAQKLLEKAQSLRKEADEMSVKFPAPKPTWNNAKENTQENDRIDNSLDNNINNNDNNLNSSTTSY